MLPQRSSLAANGRRSVVLTIAAGAIGLALTGPVTRAEWSREIDPSSSLLASHLLVTYYGNPHTGAMGVLGQLKGDQRAAAIRRQAAAYRTLTVKRVLPAYHLVTVVAQPRAGADRMFRRRESTDVIRALLDDARRHGFHLVLDVQPGRAALIDELAHLRPFLVEPDVHLAIDPEFDVEEGQVPGQVIGHTPAADVNAATRFLSRLIASCQLPPKVLIVHQFSVRMLPDVKKVESAPGVDVVLNMDGFGSQALKLASYRTIMRRWPLQFAGMKLFYTIDTNLLAPEDVMRLRPEPSVVIYQ